MSRDFICSVRLSGDGQKLVVLDQTLLPGKICYLELETTEQIYEAIYKLRVRGAPAIGIAAAYGVYLAALHSQAKNGRELQRAFLQAKERLASSRPTAVNLFWALKRMEKCLETCLCQPVQECLAALLREAEAVRREDEDICRRIGVNALTLLEDGWGLLTHCNAGAIATAKYGTALAPVYLGMEQGIRFHVYADETRPLLQGARLTAWELHNAGVDVTLLCDSMCSAVMRQGLINAVIVGCDRIAFNGDTANKIGTSTLAIVAKKYGIPFYVCAPRSTIDLECKEGRDIEIEFRRPEEVTTLWYEKSMAPENIKVYNPAFDITDHDLITAIITEDGVLYPPFSVTLSSTFEMHSSYAMSYLDK